MSTHEGNDPRKKTSYVESPPVSEAQRISASTNRDRGPGARPRKYRVDTRTLAPLGRVGATPPGQGATLAFR